jgi:hypothetical protein
MSGEAQRGCAGQGSLHLESPVRQNERPLTDSHEIVSRRTLV